MSNTARRLVPSLTKTETVLGWCYLPIYLVLLSVLIQAVYSWLGLECTAIKLNILYFTINFVAILLIFHHFLRQSFFGGNFWNWVQAFIIGAFTHYVGTYIINLILSHFVGYYTVFNNDTVDALSKQSYYFMLIATVLFAPITEETLLRGVVFGSLRHTSRVLAYIVSMLIFVLMHNWQYFYTEPVGAVLLSCLPYIPAAFALAWVYEKSGTIWAPICLHAMINAITFFNISI